MESVGKDRSSIKKHCRLFLEHLEDRQVLSVSGLGSMSLVQGPFPSEALSSSSVQRLAGSCEEMLTSRPEASFGHTQTGGQGVAALSLGNPDRPTSLLFEDRLPAAYANNTLSASSLPLPQVMGGTGSALLSQQRPPVAEVRRESLVGADGDRLKGMPPVAPSVLPFTPLVKRACPQPSMAQAGQTPATPVADLDLPRLSNVASPVSVLTNTVPATERTGQYLGFFSDGLPDLSVHFVAMVNGDETSAPQTGNVLQGADLCSSSSTVNTAALDAALQHLMADMDQAGRAFAQVLTSTGFLPLLMGTLVGGLALEATRRRTRRPAVGLGLVGLDQDPTFTWMPGLPGSFSAEEE